MIADFLFLYVFILLGTLIHGLDVSWIPSDPDGPLPLSTRYRSALQALCNQLASGQKLHPDVAAKKVVLQKMCRKLQESSSLTSNVFQNIPMKQILLSCLVIGGGTYAWTQRRAIFRFFRYKAIPALSIRGGQVVGDSFNGSGGSDGGGAGGGNGNTGSSNAASMAGSESVKPQAPAKQSRGPLVDMAAVREARLRHFAGSALPTVE